MFYNQQLFFLKNLPIFAAKTNEIDMTFDKILDNNTLWAVRYDGVVDNALKTLFDQWSDPEWLVDFFLANMADLESYFKITDINQAIYDTIDDNQRTLLIS